MNSNNGNVHDQKLKTTNGVPPLVPPFDFQEYGGSISVGCDLTPADLGPLEARWIERAATIPVLPFRTSIPAPNEHAITGCAATIRT